MTENHVNIRNGEKRFPPPWVFTLYFAEGFPYSLVRQISTVYFKDFGASLQAIGLTSLYGLPWVLKFSWAPLVDAFSTKRKWLLCAEGALVLAVLSLAIGSSGPTALLIGSWIFMATAILSASHDIAIDGYYLEALNRNEQARFVGLQAMSYRLALIAGGGGIVWFSGVTSWPAAFVLAAGMLAAVFAWHFFFLPRVETQKASISGLLKHATKGRNLLILFGVFLLFVLGRLFYFSAFFQNVIEPVRPYFKKLGVPDIIAICLLLILVILAANLPRIKRKLYGSESFYARAFVDYLDQPRIGVILAFLVTYRTGESFLLTMVYPMLKEIGITRADYGFIYGVFGISASIIGGITGGWLIGKFGLKKSAWPLVLAQNIPNLLYAVLAFNYLGFSHVGGNVHAPLPVVGTFVVLEAFGSGLGTALFMVFIMRTCKKSYKAGHMAIATSVMNVSSTFAGVLSGFVAAWAGFSLFFVISFIATIPGMTLIPFLPHMEK